MGTGEITTSGSLTVPLRRRPPTESTTPFRSALIELCFERGLRRVTVADLCRRAGLTPVVFRQFHSNVESCVFDICCADLERYRHLVDNACVGLVGWRSRLRATAYALYRFIAQDERLRRFTAMEARTVGWRTTLLVATELSAFCDLIDEGRNQPAAPRSLTRATAEALCAGIVGQLFLAAGPQELPPESEVIPAFMFAAVLPYEGATVAAEELILTPPL